MALVKCPECSNEVSSQASSCPRCGYPMRKITVPDGPVVASEPKSFLATATWGPVVPNVLCPHCQVKGRVRAKRVKRKQGLSGGKATAAVLTAGFSLLAVGLSRKQWITEAHCGNCSSDWAM